MESLVGFFNATTNTNVSLLVLPPSGRDNIYFFLQIDDVLGQIEKIRRKYVKEEEKLDLVRQETTRRSTGSKDRTGSGRKSQV